MADVDSNAASTDADEVLVARVSYQIGLAVGFSESKLAKERQEIAYYYQGERPFKSSDGDSSYRSLDVYDGVEGMKAQLLEVFAGASNPVMFIPIQGEPPQAAEIRTDYCNHVVFNQNDGYNLLQTTITDGLLNRAGVVKVWWEEKHDWEYRVMTNAAFHEVAAFLAQNPGAEIQSSSGKQEGDVFEKVRLKIRKDRSQVRMKCIPPEQFGIAPMAEDLQSAEFCFHREPKTVSDLIKEGYDPKLVGDLEDTDRLWMETEPEVLTRFQPTDDMIAYSGTEDGQKSRRRIMVYECYMEINESGDDEEEVSQLYKIVYAGDRILHKEPVDRKPFCAFVPLPRPHTFWGHPYAKLLIPTQTARTYLTRSIINHALITNNPRIMVARGTVDNPRELMENRIGGIVNVKRIDGIMPVPQAGLNPFVFQTIQLLDKDKEEVTGISQLSQGLNGDAISKQNSQGMVQDLVNLSQVRQKIIARNFAEGFLRQLYTMVYQLVVDNADRQDVIYVSGNWIPVDPTRWPETCELEVSFHLGYGEGDKQMMKWQALDAYFSKDPHLQVQYTPDKRWNVLQKAMKCFGIKDPSDFITPLTQPVTPPPNPMQQAEIAVKNADAQVKLANAKAAETQAQISLLEAQTKARESMMRIELETQKAQTQLQLEQAKLAHKVAVDAAEITLQQDAQAQDKLQAEAQPTRS